MLQTGKDRLDETRTCAYISEELRTERDQKVRNSIRKYDLHIRVLTNRLSRDVDQFNRIWKRIEQYEEQQY